MLVKNVDNKYKCKSSFISKLNYVNLCNKK